MSCFWNVCCLEYQIVDEVQEPSNPKYCILNPLAYICAFNIFRNEMWKHAQKTVCPPHCLQYNITMKYSLYAFTHNSIFSAISFSLYFKLMCN